MLPRRLQGIHVSVDQDAFPPQHVNIESGVVGHDDEAVDSRAAKSIIHSASFKCGLVFYLLVRDVMDAHGAILYRKRRFEEASRKPVFSQYHASCTNWSSSTLPVVSVSRKI